MLARRWSLAPKLLLCTLPAAQQYLVLVLNHTANNHLGVEVVCSTASARTALLAVLASI